MKFQHHFLLIYPKAAKRLPPVTTRTGVFPSIKFPSIHIAPPTAAKGSKAGISTPGVEVRNIPVTKPTSKIPTLRESTDITTVATIDDYIVYSPY